MRLSGLPPEISTVRTHDRHIASVEIKAEKESLIDLPMKADTQQSFSNSRVDSESGKRGTL
jgi:hypothetical protein